MFNLGDMVIWKSAAGNFMFGKITNIPANSYLITIRNQYGAKNHVDKNKLMVTKSNIMRLLYG